MGQEIFNTQFTANHFSRFRDKLRAETDRLREWFEHKTFAADPAVGGFELEAWLTNGRYAPKPCNDRFLQAVNSELVVPELARFNVELNAPPRPLREHSLQMMHADLASYWRICSQIAGNLGCHLVMIGILPTVTREMLNLGNMSDQNRYRALNEQVFQQRKGRPLRLDITGKESLRLEHHDVMLEAAATSFQIHLQTPLKYAVRNYNASIIVSGAMVAASANSPYLFGHQLWEETRIPLFEQAVEVGGYDGAAQGPIRRVTFGSDYAHQSLMECFEENLLHYPVLLPIAYDEPPQKLAHLRLHNGTIWRWNRPLIGFNEVGTPHLRIEHRVVPGGPTCVDEIANAAFYFGLVRYLSTSKMAPELRIPFTHSRDNFYSAARLGLNATLTWFEGKKMPARALILNELLPMAHDGLQMLAIDTHDRLAYLGIIEERVRSGQTGAQWQREFVARNGKDMEQLTRAYHEKQQTCLPVHLWAL